MNVCPKGAISMEKDEYGFVYPEINYDKCISCGACKRVCGYGSREGFVKPKKVYAAAAVDEKVLKNSASGGMFAALAENTLENGGTVYGAAMPYEEGRLVPKHIRIEKKEDIIKLQGSKYVQSDTGFTYSEAKKDLENGLYVLYSGTPCQIAGLKNYLNKDYEKLLTAEIICHGVPSTAFFNDFIENERKRRNVKEITSFSFRDKSRGQDMSSRLIMLDKNGNSKEKVIYGKTSSYVSLFLKSLTYRENCYSCPYAVPERGADVTLGDFWGFHEEYPSKENTADLSNSKGISCMLINTEKGKRIVADIKDRLSIMESEFDKVACHNDQLRTPSKYNSLREHILELYKDKGYAAVEGYYRKKYRAERIARSVIWILPKGLKRTMKQLKPKK